MNKCGHLLVTRDLGVSQFDQYRFWVQLGCILPDILMYTYLVGHTWDESYSKIIKKMKKLEKRGEMNWYSCLKLGYILHYIEDYFTFPHNAHYNGSLKDHVQYEAKFSLYLKEKQTTPVTMRNNEVVAVDMLCDCIKVSHQKYMQKNGNYENDRENILQVTNMVIECFYLIFQKNQLRYEMDVDSNWGLEPRLY